MDPVETLNDGLAAIGLVMEDEEPLEIEEEYCLWPENLAIFDLWLSLQTQWVRLESGKRVGLNYAGVRSGMWMDGFSSKEQREFFPYIRAMEIAVLNDSSQSK